MRHIKLLFAVLFFTFIIGAHSVHAAFTPSSINGLQLWFSADSGVYGNAAMSSATSSDGAKVLGWADQSGHSNNATQTATVNAPILKLNQINGLPALRFDAASSQFMRHPYTGEPATVFVVGKLRRDPPDNDTWLGADTSDSVAVGAYYFKAGNAGLDLESIRTVIGDTGGSSWYAFQHIASVYNQWYIQAGTESPTDITLWKNNVKVAQKSTTTPLTRLPIQAGTTVIGSSYYADSLNGSFLTGDIAELLVYDNVLSESQMAQVNEYLAAKYGISLPVNPVARPTYVFPTFNAYEQLRILYSSDGINFQDTLTRLDGDNKLVRDPDMFYADGSYWIAYTTSPAGGFSTSTYFAIAKSPTWDGAYTQVATVDMTATIPGVKRVWSPIHFIDPADGSFHILFSAATSTQADNFRQYRIEPTNAALTTWGTPTEIGGVVNAYSNVIAGYIMKKDSTYYLWGKDDSATSTGGKYNFVLSSPAPFSGYTTYKSGNWAGWGQHRYEGAYPLKVGANKWRVYFDGYGIGGGESYSESTDDWATWTAPQSINAPWPLSANGLMLFSSASIAPDVPTLVAGSANNIVTLVGSGTNWIKGLPSSSTFSLSGGTGAYIASQSVVDSTHATLTIFAGDQPGTIVISDPSTNASANISVVSSGIRQGSSHSRPSSVSSAGYGSVTSNSSATTSVALSGATSTATTGGTVMGTPFFPRSLTLGSTGLDVLNLQKYLNAKGFTVAPTGAGSKGNETTLFGGLTRTALARFQKANNISPAIGYFGPITRAFVIKNQ